MVVMRTSISMALTLHKTARVGEFGASWGGSRLRLVRQESYELLLLLVCLIMSFSVCLVCMMNKSIIAISNNICIYIYIYV